MTHTPCKICKDIVLKKVKTLLEIKKIQAEKESGNFEIEWTKVDLLNDILKDLKKLI